MSEEDNGIQAIVSMLSSATAEEGVTVFDHSAEEIGIAVMGSHAAVLAALKAAPREAPIDPLGLLELAQQCSLSDNASAIELGDVIQALAMDIPDAKLRARKAITDRYYAGGKVVQLTPVKPAQLVDIVFEAAIPVMLAVLSPSATPVGTD